MDQNGNKDSLTFTYKSRLWVVKIKKKENPSITICSYWIKNRKNIVLWRWCSR